MCFVSLGFHAGKDGTYFLRDVHLCIYTCMHVHSTPGFACLKTNSPHAQTAAVPTPCSRLSRTDLHTHPRPHRRSRMSVAGAEKDRERDVEGGVVLWGRVKNGGVLVGQTSLNERKCHLLILSVKDLFAAACSHKRWVFYGQITEDRRRVFLALEIPHANSLIPRAEKKTLQGRGAHTTRTSKQREG